MPGFSKPTTTQTPDALLDYWLTRLAGSELRVLLYAVRRTYGFKRDEDAIGLDQFLHGITTRDGAVLDEGIGISRRALLYAIKSLADKGLLLKGRHVDDGGRDTVSTYRLSIVDERHPRAAQGVRAVNTTQVPDEIFDYWLSRLSDAELRACLQSHVESDEPGKPGPSRVGKRSLEPYNAPIERPTAGFLSIADRLLGSLAL